MLLKNVALLKGPLFCGFDFDRKPSKNLFDFVRRNLKAPFKAVGQFSFKRKLLTYYGSLTNKFS